jgi:hypothetical protein
MVEDKDSSPHRETLPPANDNVGRTVAREDVRILRIAAAIGRKLARDHMDRIQAVNDNRSTDRDDLSKSALKDTRP